MKDEIEIYSMGALSMSVCAPKNMDEQGVLDKVEKENPAGTSNGWMISEHKTFHSGHPIPCQCEDDPERQHWLIVA